MFRHAGLLEIRTIPAKKDIAFVEFADETTATVAKDALHNFKIDGETKMKVRFYVFPCLVRNRADEIGHVCTKISGVCSADRQTLDANMQSCIP